VYHTREQPVSYNLARRLHIAPSQIGQDTLKESPLLFIQVPFGLFFQHTDRIDGMFGQGQISLLFAGLRIGNFPKMQQG